MKRLLRALIERSDFDIEPLRGLRHQLHLAGLRWNNRINPVRLRQQRQLRTLRDVKLHFGSGSRIFDGWINLDAYPADGVDYLMDLRSELPFEDGSVRYIFSEHVVEHLERAYLPRILREFLRVLMPGGVARIVVPDLEFYCEKYVAGDVAELSIPLPECRTSADAVNSVFMDHFHRFIYDFDTLRDELTAAGFGDVRRTAYAESEYDGLALDLMDPSRASGSLCVEAIKTPSDG